MSEEAAGPAPASVDELPPPQPMTARQRAVYLQYLAVWETIARLPEPLAWRLPDRLGDLALRLSSDRRRRQVRANQARVQPGLDDRGLDRAVRATYRSYARYWVDAFRAHTYDADWVAERTELDGVEILDEVVAEGRGAILATGHLGSWDLGAFFSDRRGWGLTVVTEVLEPRALFDRFVKLRRRLGMGIVPFVRGGDMLARLEQVVRDGGTATLLADRDLSRKGPIVEFFGEPCRLPPGAAALARRTGRPVVPGAFLTTPRGWRAVVREPVDVTALSVEAGTQVVAHAVERIVREAPHQWHVFVPNWLAEREPDHPVVAEWRAGSWKPPRP